MPTQTETPTVQAQPRAAGSYFRRRERADLLATVIRIVQQISHIRDLSALLSTIAHETQTSFGYSSVAVWLSEGQMLICRASAGAGAAEVAEQHALGAASPAALAIKHGCLMFSESFAEQSACTTYPIAHKPCVALPLIGDGRSLGALEVRGGPDYSWRSADLEALLALAKQAATAIENAQRTNIEFDQLYAALQSRADQLALVDDISRAVTASLDQHDALQAVVTQVPRAVSCHSLSLSSYDPARRCFTIRALWLTGVKTTLEIGEEVLVDQTEAAHAVDSGHLHYISDLSLSRTDYSRRLREVEGLRSVVYIPIMSSDGCLGLLSLARNEPNAFLPNDLALLSSLAPHIATAFKNAALYAQAQQAYTELAAAQERTLQNERLRAIGELASGVAHDFNNLLAIILGHVELLKTPDSPHFDRSRRMIMQAAQDGAHTVRRIQEFVRAKPETHTTPVDLSQLADDVINLTRPRWHNDMLGKGARVALTRNLPSVPLVLGNGAELREVVTNLILNAIDAMPHGGSLAISTGSSNGFCWIEVADSGHGIPAEVRARIFEPFYTTKANRGTGLGLAVSRSIALRHNGDLAVESTPGQGSRFRMSLPIADQPAPVAVEVAAPVVVRPLRILLVEDDRAVRETLAQLLMLDDHKVTCAENGATALEIFQPDAYDLVCSDLGMPGIVGWDLLKQLRERDPAITTVLISGWGAQIDAEEARARQVDFVVPKPIDIDMLNSVLAEAQRRAR